MLSYKPDPGYRDGQTICIEFVACNQVLYTVAVTVLFPGSILALAAGAVFGLVLGSLLVWIGTVLGQTFAFIIGRSALYPLISALSSLVVHLLTVALLEEGVQKTMLLLLFPAVKWYQNELQLAWNCSACILCMRCYAA